MDCEKVRRGLFPPERPRLAGAEVVEARRHLEACPECRSWFEQDRALLDAYARLRDRRAPPEVREKVFDVLARERAGGEGAGPAAGPAGPAALNPGAAGGRRRVAAAALVVAVAGVAGVAAWRLAWGPGDGPADAAAAGEDGGAVFVEDYLRRAVGQDRVVTDDPDEVARFLTRELGRPLAPLPSPSLTVVSAETCLLEGRRGAMIVYRRDGRSLYHYLIPADEVARRPPTPAPHMADAVPGAPGVVTWATPGVEQALVGMDTDVLLALVADVGEAR